MSIAEEDFRPQQILPFIDIGAWENATPPKRQWGVAERIPLRQPTLLSGNGAIGKTLVLLQLCVAHVLGRDWLGTLPEPGPVIFVGAEDEPDELWRRLADILGHYGASMRELNGRLHLLSLAGEDAILGRPQHNGCIAASPLFNRLLEAALDIRPILIALDTSADVYAGDENNRAQVRQFVGMLRHMTIRSNSSLILTAHPSLTGINTGSGLSGTTGWHNSVRARIYMHPAETEQGDEPDPELRQLEFLKNNYGAKAETILLRWKNGVFVPTQGAASLDKMAADANAERVFLTILSKFNGQYREVSSKPSSIYAPNVFAKEPAANGLKSKALEGAMSRLLDSKKIHLKPEGPPSHRRYRLVAGAPDHEAAGP